jgi:hypothetical protein
MSANAPIETPPRYRNGKLLCSSRTKKGKGPLCTREARYNDKCWQHEAGRVISKITPTVFSPVPLPPGVRKGKSRLEDLQLKQWPEEGDCDASYRMACVRGSKQDKAPLKSWIRVWCKVWNVAFEVYQLDPAPCIVENCPFIGTVGGHLWLRGNDKQWDMEHCYIAPICSKCNKTQTHELLNGFYTKPGSTLVKMLPHICYEDYHYLKYRRAM